MKNFLWLISFIKPYIGKALLNIFFGILVVVFSLFSIAMVIPFLNLLFDTQKLVHEVPTTSMFSKTGISEWFNYYLSHIIITQGQSQALFFVCVLVAVLFFFKNLFRWLQQYFVSPVKNAVLRDLRNALYEKTLHLQLAYFSEQRKGDIMTRMSNDVQEVDRNILSSLEIIFREPFSIVAFVATLFVLSPHLTLFILVLLPLSGLIIGRIGKTLKKSSSLVQEKASILMANVEETLSGIRIIKAFTAELFSKNRFEKTTNEHYRLAVKVDRRYDLASPTSEFLGAIVLVTVMWFGGQLIFKKQGELSPSTFIYYIAVFSQIISPAKAFTTAFSSIQKGLASVERIKSILNEPINITEKRDAIGIKDFNHQIEYKGLSFAYRNYDDEQVLKNINLLIPKGKTIALVGQSGAGKSTMADLLPRFYDPTIGDLLIDGVSLRDLKLKDLRSLMGVVTQESILFNDTVFNNIAFGMPNATEQDVINAASVANAHEFIKDLEHGYYTNIGDRGGKLSGGQRQRLNIARAVLKNPPILILDEATSALDTESERLVQDALTKLMQNRTSLVIAHRLSTIQHADEIVVMHKGKIVERGSHSQLIEQKGTYRKLHDLQAFS